MTTAAQRAAYTYTYVEPHPSLPKSQQLSTGRGGAGNATRLHPQDITEGSSATGPASRSPLVKSSSAPRRIAVGRGGAGNVKQPAKTTESERTQYELEREERLDRFDAIQAENRTWHYGRGGSGNVLDQSRSREGSVASSRRDSIASSRSGSSRKGSLADKVSSMLRRGSNESAN